MLLNISENELKEIIEEAFEKGFHGCLDLKEEVVSELMERLLVDRLLDEEDREFDLNSRLMEAEYRDRMFERIRNDPFVQATEWLNSPYTREQLQYSPRLGVYSNEPNSGNIYNYRNESSWVTSFDNVQIGSIDIVPAENDIPAESQEGE